MNIIEIDNVQLNFGVTEILKAIYFKAEKGKVTGILGSNGSGKTSFLRIIFGELKPQNKLIRINSKPVLTPLYKKGFIKFLPQFHIFPETLSVKKAFYLFEASITNFLIDFPDFTSQIKNNFSQFSGGEKRLIETYIMLTSKTEIVLLDEPFSHLAPLYVQKIKELIAKEKKNKIIIVTDHLYRKILDISDEVYLLKDGWSRIIKSPEELIQYKYINSL